MAAQEWNAKLSLDLLIAVKNEREFLRKIHSYGGKFYEQEFLKNAIRRYEQFWMPLLAKSGKLNLIPPLDVHFVWHTHMLSPLSYKIDCERIVGRVLDHHLWNVEELGILHDSSSDVWSSNFPNEPYDVTNVLRPIVSAVSQQSIPYDQKSTYDLIVAIQNQREFYFQISMPHYASIRFMSVALERYMRFLNLHKHTVDFMIPPFDIQLIWRSHMVHPLFYANDTVSICGRILTHHNGLVENQKSQAENLAHRLWKNQYPTTPFQKRGAHSRGFNGPWEVLKSPSPDDHRRGKMMINSISLKCYSTPPPSMHLKLHYDDRLIKKFAINCRDQRKFHWSSGSIICFHYDRRQMHNLRIELDQASSKINHNAASKIDANYPMEGILDFWIANPALKSRNLLMHLSGEMDGKLMRADLGLNATVALKTRLKMTPGHFHTQKLNASHPLYELVKMFSLEFGSGEKIQEVFMASHWLNDLKRDAQYTVEIVHFHNQTLIIVLDRRQRPLSIGYVMNSRFFPNSDDLEECVPLATPHVCNENDRFVCVVNKNGDFAVIKAKWHSDYSYNGSLGIEYFDLCSDNREIIQVPDARNKTEFKFGGISADLKSDRIACNSLHTAEKIAAIFGIAMLFNLCMDQSAVNECKKWPLVAAIGSKNDRKRSEMPDEFAGI